MVDQYEDEIDVERIPRRYIHNLEDPIEKHSDEHFLKRYRFPKVVVMNNLLDLLGIHYTNNRGLPIPSILQLLTTLWFYATSNFQVRRCQLVDRIKNMYILFCRLFVEF